MRLQEAPDLRHGAQKSFAPENPPRANTRQLRPRRPAGGLRSPARAILGLDRKHYAGLLVADRLEGRDLDARRLVAGVLDEREEERAAEIIAAGDTRGVKPELADQHGREVRATIHESLTTRDMISAEGLARKTAPGAEAENKVTERKGTR